MGGSQHQLKSTLSHVPDLFNKIGYCEHNIMICMHAIHLTYIDAVQLMHACLNLGAGIGGGGVSRDFD